MELQVESDAGQRLDIYLAGQLSEYSRSRIQDLIRKQYILCNGKPAKPRDAVAIGDHISINPPEEIPDIPQAEELPLNVIYEDEALLVVNKEVGVVVHPAAGNVQGTLVNALLWHCQGGLSDCGGTQRPGIVHRLDKDTSGCLVVAKTNDAHQALVKQFAARTVARQYLAITQNCPAEDQGEIFTHIARHPVNRKMMSVCTPPAGKAALTEYTVIAKEPETKTALVLCDLHTGRTHQIRVHFKHLSCPLIGDVIYAKPHRQSIQTGRLMLHAWKLGFTHPLSGKEVSFTAPIPSAFDLWTNLSQIPLQ